MNVTVVLLIEKNRGTVARVAETLRDAGVSVHGHSAERGDETRCRVRVSAEAESPPSRAELETLLREVEGVVSLMDVQEEAPPAEPSPASAAHETAPPDPWVDKILRAYPRILGAVDEFHATVSRDEREHRLTKLGVQVGKLVGADRPPITSAPTVEEALARGVLPALKSIATGAAEGSELHVRWSIFTRRELDMMFLSQGAEPSGCYFLTGLILGMLTAGSLLPPVRVSEPECRELGDPVCIFRVEPLSG